MPRDFDRNDISDLRKGPQPPVPEIPGCVLHDSGADAAGGEGVGAADATRKKDGGTWWKVLAALGLGCLGINLIVGALAVAGLAVGLSSCVASCSDSPIGDSRENAAFVADLAATERDLSVFDALGASIAALQERRVREGDGVPSADELRAQVSAGSWPKERGGDALSARVWVRIAELSQDWLEEQTGERWEVVDFSYPFPDNGPIPVPATRDEDSHCLTRLLCRRGDDRGLYVTVAYYRWAKEAYFESDLSEPRAEADALAQLDRDIADTGLLGTRRYVVSQGDLVVWAQGADDALRDPEAFLDAARQLAALLGDYHGITLVSEDMPVVLGYETLSSDFSNERPLKTVPYEQGRARLLRADYVLYLDHAAGDELLSCRCQPDEDLTSDALTGILAPTPQQEFRHPWREPSEACTFDEAMTAEVAGLLGADLGQAVVASNLDTSDRMYDSLQAWVILPGGVMPETPQAFCASCEALRDAFWATIPLREGKNAQLYLHIFVVDETTLADAAGEAATFAQLREVAQARPADLEGWHVELLLTTMAFGSQWDGEEAPSLDDVRPRDVGGSIARSRAWRYSEQ